MAAKEKFEKKIEIVKFFTEEMMNLGIIDKIELIEECEEMTFVYGIRDKEKKTLKTLKKKIILYL